MYDVDDDADGYDVDGKYDAGVFMILMMTTMMMILVMSCFAGSFD